MILYHKIDLPSLNSDTSCVLPNGENVVISLRLRPKAEYWTISISDQNGNLLFDELPFISSDDLAAHLPHLRSQYGVFSCIDVKNNAELAEYINNKLFLLWRP